MLPLFSTSIDVEFIESVDDWELNIISLSTDCLNSLLQAWVTCLDDKDFVANLRRHEADFLKSCPGFLILDGNHRNYVRQFHFILLFGYILGKLSICFKKVSIDISLILNQILSYFK
jgi:hypothetical protein